MSIALQLTFIDSLYFQFFFKEKGVTRIKKTIAPLVSFISVYVFFFVFFFFLFDFALFFHPFVLFCFAFFFRSFNLTGVSLKMEKSFVMMLF